MPEASVYDAASEQPAPEAAVEQSKPARKRSTASGGARAQRQAANVAVAEREAPSLPRNWRVGDAVPVGTEVAYRIRLYGEWVPATVIDEIPPPNKQGFPLALDAPDEGCVHLAIKLTPKRHHSAASTGYRQNVPYGDKVGNWLPSMPGDNAARVEAAQAREQEMIKTRRQIMRGDALSVTDEALT